MHINSFLSISLASPSIFCNAHLVFHCVFYFCSLTFLAASFYISISLLGHLDKCMPIWKNYFHLVLGFVPCLHSFSSFPFDILLDISFCVHESDLQTGGLHILSLFERNLPCFAIDMSCYEANMYLTLAEGNHNVY